MDGFRALDKSSHLRETRFLGDQEHLLTGWWYTSNGSRALADFKLSHFSKKHLENFGAQYTHKGVALCRSNKRRFLHTHVHHCPPHQPHNPGSLLATPLVFPAFFPLSPKTGLPAFFLPSIMIRLRPALQEPLPPSNEDLLPGASTSLPLRKSSLIVFRENKLARQSKKLTQSPEKTFGAGENVSQWSRCLRSRGLEKTHTQKTEFPLNPPPLTAASSPPGIPQSSEARAPGGRSRNDWGAELVRQAEASGQARGPAPYRNLALQEMNKIWKIKETQTL